MGKLRDIGSRSSGGFTLVELLVVVVILGVLVGTVVVAVGAFADEGVESACDVDAKSVEAAQEAYRAKTGGYATSFGQLTSGGYLRSEPDGGTEYEVDIDGNCTIL